MLIDTTLTKDIDRTAEVAAEAEAGGFDALWLGETTHEPFLQLLRAAEATSTITVGTSIAIAFARSPMTLANAGYDMARYSRGRFVLGLGSQVKPHIERRFSMPWSHPAPRMREMILALRAIWRTWSGGEPLDFTGEYYTHTLMTPFFSPPAHEWGAPPVYLAGVGARMTEVAGEVCDGFFFHPFTTDEYLRSVTLPALRAGREAAGRADLDGFAVAGPAFACFGRTDEEMAAAVKGTKAQIAFYASTPTYRPVLDMHGWGDLQPHLTRMSKQGQWSQMGEEITDEMLHAFAVVGTPEEAGRALSERWGPVATRLSIYANFPTTDDTLRAVAAAARG